jgi:MtN3 and saliva related transmembrane protein
MVWADFVGQAAGILCSVCLIPQLIRICKLRSAHEVSIAFTSILLLGMLAWVVYGIFYRLLPIIIWDSIATIQVVALIVFKMKYGSNKQSQI